MKLSEYTYRVTRYGWEVLHKGTIIAGYSVNVNLLKGEYSINRQEFHRDIAKQKLYEIIENERNSIQKNCN